MQVRGDEDDDDGRKKPPKQILVRRGGMLTKAGHDNQFVLEDLEPIGDLINHVRNAMEEALVGKVADNTAGDVTVEGSSFSASMSFMSDGDASFASGTDEASSGAAGVLQRQKSSRAASARRADMSTFMDRKQYREFTLIDKVPLSHNTCVFRFDLPGESALEMPACSHLALRTRDHRGKLVSRPYTPISSVDDKGYFDLLIKLYPGGVMSTALFNMAVGETIEVKGPNAGKLRYRKGMAKHLGLIAGGTGITPMWQIIESIMRDNTDKTMVTLLYCNSTEADILLRPQLDEMAKKHPTRFEVYHTVSKPKPGWRGWRGRISEQMLYGIMPPPTELTLMVTCCPPALTEMVAGKAPGIEEDEEDDTHWTQEQREQHKRSGGRKGGLLSDMQYPKYCVFE